MQNINLGDHVSITEIKASVDYIEFSTKFDASLKNIELKSGTVINVRVLVHDDEANGDDYPCDSIAYYSCLQPSLATGNSFDFVFPNQCGIAHEGKKVKLEIALYLSGEQHTRPEDGTFSFNPTIEKTTPDLVANQVKTWDNNQRMVPVSFSSTPAIPFPDARIIDIFYDSTKGVAFTIDLGEGQTYQNYFWVGFWFSYEESYSMVNLTIPPPSGKLSVILPIPKMPPTNIYPMFSLLFEEHPPGDYSFSNRTRPQ